MVTAQQPKRVIDAADRLREQFSLNPHLHPVGLILGTGFSSFMNKVVGKEVLYSDLPDLPQVSTPTHAGAFVYGDFAGVPILAAAGRCHLYEGYSAEDVVIFVRILHALGVRVLLLTNAAGALNPTSTVGHLFMALDQINMTGESPLRGKNHAAWGVRFPDMCRPFDRELAALAEGTALSMGIPLEKGTYIGVHGPELETPAETRLYRQLGADAIGMSSVLEVIAARHLGLRVLQFSALSNKNLPDCMEEMTIEKIVAQSTKTEESLQILLTQLMPHLYQAGLAS